MATANWDSIQKKLEDWERSEKAQKKIQSTIDRYIRTNKSRTDAGGHVITKAEIKNAATKLVTLIKSYARGYNLPASVMAHFDSLTVTAATRSDDGSYTVEINFTDDLSRESLQPDKYGGVDNIIAIFNNGYPADRSRSAAISYVHGWWHSRETQALEYRPGLYFLQDAVNDFNENYGMALGMYAELGTVYESE